MQMTLDIPEPLYRWYEERAELEGRSAEQVMVDVLGGGGSPEPNEVKITYDGTWGWPVIHSNGPGAKQVGPEDVDAHIDLP